MARTRKLCNKVEKKSTSEIRLKAQEVRKALFASQICPSEQYIDVAVAVDKLNAHGVIELEIVEDSTLSSEYAVTAPDRKKILIRESVYLNACNGVPRDRFTIAHELGHLFLHRGISPTFARSQSISFHSYEEDAEWQADMFASELLIDCYQLENVNSPKDIVTKFGVSWECANIAHQKLANEGFL